MFYLIKMNVFFISYTFVKSIYLSLGSGRSCTVGLSSGRSSIIASEVSW